jgi:hypothetical protein
VKRAVDRWLLAAAPARRLAALRILTGVYATLFLVGRFPSMWSMADLPSRQFDPVGALFWLQTPIPAASARGLLVVTLILGVAFTAGAKWRLVGPGFALAFFTVVSYRLSWGHVLHGEHLPALYVLVIGFSSAAAAWSYDAASVAGSEPLKDSRFGWPIKVLMLVTVVAYVLAGVAKLRIGGPGWITGDALRNQVAYDNLRKVVMGDAHSPLGAWMVRHWWVFPPMAILTLVVELGAPAALVRGRLRAMWVAGAWLFHVGIWMLMAIAFPFQLFGFAYAPFFDVERVGERVLVRVRARKAMRTGLSDARRGGSVSP